jgi:hypothetical protein
MEIITLDNIRHYNFYNICDRTKNLNECNISKDLFCIKCEIFKKIYVVIVIIKNIVKKMNFKT